MSRVEHIELPVIPIANDQYESFGGKRWRVVGYFSSATAQNPTPPAPITGKPRAMNDKSKIHLIQK